MAIALLTSDGPGVLAAFLQSPQWGIFDQIGQPVLIGDTVKAFGFRSEERVSKYPVEQGQFASYNKVATPSEPRMTFTVGGTQSDRANFLAACEAAKQSLYLFVAVTPEASYRNMNVIHYDYDRGRADANQITVDVWMEEIRQAPSLSFSNTKTPDGAQQQNGGTVQPQTPASQTTIPSDLRTENPGLITTTTPTTSVTNAAGNELPPGVSPIGATVTYTNDATGESATGVVESIRSYGGHLNGYNLTDGSSVGRANVTAISAQGYRTVQ